MKHVFRTTARYWASEDGFALIIGIAFTIPAYWFENTGLTIGGLLILLLYLPSAYKLFRARLEIDEQSIALFGREGVTRVDWSEVVYAELAESFYKPKKSLILGVGDAEDHSEIGFPIDNFDHQQIWRLVQEFAPAPAAEDGARRNTTTYRAWAKEEAKAVNRVTKTLRVSDSWLVRIGSWFILMMGLSVFVFFILLSQTWRRESDPLVALVIQALTGLLFTWFGSFSLLTSGRTEFDRDKITRRIPLGTYQIRWDEITMIEECAAGTCVIYCRDGYLSFSSPSWWSGKDRWEASSFWDAQIELRNIKIRKRSLSFKVARNTKVK
ncbi:MAG: hypothetical protein AB7U82_05335 [Blastocatellales bacterium]